MGINVDDSLLLTKFIQQGTTNSKHRSLAQTIFSTPNMTLKNATSLFATYTPAEPSSSNVRVNAVTRYRDIRKTKCQLQPKDQKSSSQKTVTKGQRFSCVNCESIDHSSHLCPRRAEVKKRLA